MHMVEVMGGRVRVKQPQPRGHTSFDFRRRRPKQHEKHRGTKRKTHLTVHKHALRKRVRGYICGNAILASILWSTSCSVLRMTMLLQWRLPETCSHVRCCDQRVSSSRSRYTTVFRHLFSAAVAGRVTRSADIPETHGLGINARLALVLFS